MDKDTYSALIDTERSGFLAACWERNEAPSDEAWRANLRRVACVYLHAAHKLMRHAIEDDESIEEHNQAVDEIVTLVNEDLRLSPAPWLPGDTWTDDDEFMAAWHAREAELQTMPYADYLRTPEWAEQRRGALRRSGGRCETCGRDERLHVHHRTYGRRGGESVDDLIVLCEDCHLAVHTEGGSHRPRGTRAGLSEQGEP